VEFVVSFSSVGMSNGFCVCYGMSCVCSVNVAVVCKCAVVNFMGVLSPAIMLLCGVILK
jgi:hypothetical protein